MKKAIGIWVGALICSLAATAFAATNEGSERLSRLGASEGNFALLFPVDESWGGTVCSNKTAMAIDLTTEAGRQMYHTALAAYLAGQPVKAFWSACHSTGHPKAERIDILPN